MEFQESLLIALAHALKELRNRHSMSQVQLSIKSGISRQQISKIERGVSQVSMVSIWKLSFAIGITPSSFVELVDQKLTLLNPNWKDEFSGSFKNVADRNDNYLK